MYCRVCGNEVNPNAEICVNCGSRPTAGHHYCGHCGSETKEKQELCLECGRFLAKHVEEKKMAGFWLRVAAYMIDFALLFAGVFVLYILFFFFAMFLGVMFGEAGLFAALWAYVIFYLLIIGMTAVYYIFMNASKHQGTLGKIAVGIKITDMDGNRLTLGKSALRYLSFMVSGLTLGVGFIIAAFTEKKQALHDLMVSTLVVKKSASAGTVVVRQTEMENKDGRELPSLRNSSDKWKKEVE